MNLENTEIKYSVGTDSITTGDIPINYNWYIREWYPYWITYNPGYTYIKEDAFVKAFKVAKMLLAKKLLKSTKLRDFIELVELVAKEVK